MKEATEKKSRKWVVRTAIIFFAAMLILLFFSNTIYNYSLPQVTVVYSSPGQMTSAIKGTGTIEAVTASKVVSDGAHKVATVNVSTYDTVQKGDVLVTYEAQKAEDNADLKAAQDALDQLLRQQYTEDLQKKPHDYTMLERSISDAQKAMNQANATYASAQGKAAAVASAQTALSSAQATYTARNAELTTMNLQKDAKTQAVADAQTTLLAVKEDPTATQEQIDAAQAVYDNAAADLAAYATQVNNKTNEVTAADAAVTAAQSKLADAQALPSIADAADAVTAAQRTLDDANKALTDQKKADQIQDIIDSLTDSDQKKQIQEAQKKVDDLKAVLNTTTIIAPVSGIISTIGVSAGSEVAKGDAILSIDVTEDGYKVPVSFTTDQVTQGQMQIGMGAREEYSWGGNEDDAVIVAIKPDSTNPRTQRIVTFKLNDDGSTGRYYSGQSLTLTLNNRSKNYDCIVPLSAVHEESGETFVYTVKTKTSPLGDRYVAIKVPVTILGKDDTNAAINPDALSQYGSMVITETNDKSFKSGDQVRLAES